MERPSETCRVFLISNLDTSKQLRPAGSRLPRLYGLPKIHKEGVPLTSIISNISAPTYQLSKYVAGLLNQLTGNSANHMKNSFQFVQTLKSLRVQPVDLMVSFEVVSLPTFRLWIHLNYSVNNLKTMSWHYSNTY